MIIFARFIEHLSCSRYSMYFITRNPPNSPENGEHEHHEAWRYWGGVPTLHSWVAEKPDLEAVLTFGHIHGESKGKGFLPLPGAASSVHWARRPQIKWCFHKCGKVVGANKFTISGPWAVSVTPTRHTDASFPLDKRKRNLIVVLSNGRAGYNMEQEVANTACKPNPGYRLCLYSPWSKNGFSIFKWLWAGGGENYMEFQSAIFT